MPGSAAALGTLFAVMAVGLVVAVAAAVLLVREPETPSVPPLGLRLGITMALANRPFLRLLAAYVLNGIANGLPATLFLLFVQHVIGDESVAGPLLLVYFAAGILAVPLWLRLSYRIGKHRAWALSMLWACAVFVWVPLLGPGDVVAFGVICLLSGLSLGADMALPAAMQADVVDLDRVMSGRRRTGLFFAMWSMATKLALALAVGIAFPVLGLLGFAAEAANTPAVLAALAALYGLAPVGIKAGAVALIWRFELDSASQSELRSRIAAAQAVG
jgi:Na+/melibiose symporter-like transporter